MTQPLFKTIVQDKGTNNNGYSYAKSSSPANYADVEYQNPLPHNKECHRSTTTHCLSDPTATPLKYYVFYPANTEYSKQQYYNCPLPAIVLFHAGEFSDYNDIDDATQLEDVAVPLAKRGFVVFLCEYRRGTYTDYFPGSYTSAQQELAIYRAGQDGRGALRSIIQYQRDHHSNTENFQIDTNNIFIGGQSAGAFISINLAYYPIQTMIDQVIPGVHAYLGSINQDFYKGDTTIDYFKKIKGVIDMWGNGYLPASYISNPSAFFQNIGNFPAMIAFNGQLDQTAPPYQTPIEFSPSESPHEPFHSESNCLPYHSPPYTVININGADLYAFGAYNIYNILTAVSPMELYIDCQMHHGLDCDPTEQPGCTTTFQSDFGTGYVHPEDVYEYIAERTAVFFQAVLTGKAYITNMGQYSLGQSKFIECKNTRVGCNAATMSCNGNTCN